MNAATTDWRFFKLKCVQPAAKPIMLLRKYSWNLAKTPFFYLMQTANEMFAICRVSLFSTAQYI